MDPDLFWEMEIPAAGGGEREIRLGFYGVRWVLHRLVKVCYVLWASTKALLSGVLYIV